MKKKILIFILFLSNQFIFSQDKEVKLTIDFKNLSIKEIVLKIEKNSNYKFYFENSWLENEAVLFTKNYTNAGVKIILEDVFEKSYLNFLIIKNKIILSKNIAIYDKLPNNYFNTFTKDTIKTDQNTDNTVFYQEYKTSKAEEQNNISNQIILIGKDEKKSDMKKFILSGIVKNSKTGLPEPDISIIIKNKDITTSTDKRGYYSFSVPAGINYIETKSINHFKDSKKIALYNNGTLNFSLVEKISELGEVVINAKKNEKIKSAISGVTTIDLENIKMVPMVLGERDIFKIATTMPGVKTTGEGSAGYNVRGGKEDQNLILMDNAVLYNPAHFFGFFSAVNPFTTKKVVIYKGSIPAEFGGRLSSVFDITTKSGDKEKFKGEGGIGPVTSNLVLEAPLVKGKSSLLVGGRATYSGWILRSLKEKNLKKSKATFYDYIIKYSHNFNSNNSLESTLYYSNDNYSISSDSLYRYSNRILTLKYDHRIDNKNKSALILTNSEYKFGIDFESQTNQFNSFDFGYKLNETQFILKMNYFRNENHKFTYGVSSKLYQINPGDFNPKNNFSLLKTINIPVERGLESAIYLLDSYKINEKLLVDFGLRYSLYASLGESKQRIYQTGLPLNDATVIENKNYKNNEVIKTNSAFEPRLAARYFLTDDFSVKMSYDKTTQYLHLLSSNSTQSPTDSWKLSDLNVKPQLSEQISFGFFKNFNKHDLELSLEGYYKKSNNILDYKVGSQLLLAQNIETQIIQGQGKAFGVELLLKKNEGRLNGWIGYTYSRALIKLDSNFNEERVNNGEFFSANFDKPHDFSAVLNYKFTKRYSLSANMVYQTGRPITYPIGVYNFGGAQYTLYSDRNQFRIPNYYRLDVGFNVEGNHKIKKLAHSFWNVSIYNVLSRGNPYSIFFVTESGQLKAYKTSIFSVPIPTITYNFKF